MASKAKVDISGWYKVPRAWVWRLVSDRDVLAAWLLPNDFEPVAGRHFQFQGEPTRKWRGFIECEVLELVPEKRLVLSWREMPHHTPSKVSFLITESTQNDFRLRLLHEGFDHTMGLLNGLFYRQRYQTGWRRHFKLHIPKIIEHWQQHGEQAPLEGVIEKP
ncbi:MAG: SRPBCC domain-containing protein [Candidatus Hydrogenedentes bacterium]|nr:SRPBCC domain-containing protein [Candidatus Hydrogenedentota bacterium]